MRIRFLFLFLFSLFCTHSMSQTIGLTYQGIGDNREFFSGYNKAETILGSRLSLDVATKIEGIHQVKAGLSYFYEYGSEAFTTKPDLILYYAMENKEWTYKMGVIPINEVLNYPLSIISDRYIYFNPTIDGLQIKYKKPNWHMNAWVDWVSLQDSVKREQFMAGFSGASRFGNFIIEDYWYMFHNALRSVRLPDDHIEDTMGGLLLAGYDFSSSTPLDVLSVKTGILSSIWRNRRDGLEFNNAYSSYSEIKAEYKGYGVLTTLNFGDKHHFSHGDSFYNNTTQYIRIDGYFTPINFEKIKGRFTWSLHIANGDLDNQQQFSIVYLFSKDLK